MKQELLRVCLLLEKIHILIEKGLQQTISNSIDSETMPSKTDSPSSAKLPYPHLLDAADIRRLLNISRSTYYRMVQAGVLKPTLIGNRHYYHFREIEALAKMRDNF